MERIITLFFYSPRTMEKMIKPARIMKKQKKNEGRDEEPVITVLALLERRLLEVNELRCSHCCEVSQGVVDYVEGLDQSLVPGLGNLVRAVERQ